MGKKLQTHLHTFDSIWNERELISAWWYKSNSQIPSLGPFDHLKLIQPTGLNKKKNYKQYNIFLPSIKKTWVDLILYF